MANLFFIKPLLSSLSEGRSVRFGIFVLMWIIAIAVIIGGAMMWIDYWNYVSGQDAAGVIGLILFQLLFLVLIFLIFQILVIRASDVLNAEAYDQDFTVIPVFSVLLRTFGEIAATISVLYGLGLLINSWFAGHTLVPAGWILLEFLGGSGFKGGILFMVGGIIQGFIVLVASYFLAEMTILGLKVYLDIKNIRQVSDGYMKPSISTASSATSTSNQEPPKKDESEDKKDS